jgi:hypothetical protein
MPQPSHEGRLGEEELRGRREDKLSRSVSYVGFLAKANEVRELPTSHFGGVLKVSCIPAVGFDCGA